MVRRKIQFISFAFLVCLLLFMVMRQFLADFYWEMAHRGGREQDDIIEYLEKSVAIDPQGSGFHFSLGRAYLKKALAKVPGARERNQWIRKSIDEFQKAVDLQPSNSDYHFHLGLSYGSLAYPPPFYWKVIGNSFKRTAMLNPTDVGRLYSMGFYYLNEYRRLRNINRNNRGKGLPHYGRYAAISRENYQLYFRRLLSVNEEHLGKILDSCFSVTQDYPDLKGVIRDEPDDHAFLARFLNKKGMWREAKKEFQEAINLEPESLTHYSNFARALFRRGDFEKAIRLWKKQQSLDAPDEKAYLSLANGFIRLRRFDEALREMRDLLRIYPEETSYQFKLIRTLLAAKRVDEAIDEYHKMRGKDPDFPREMYETIRHYQRIGNYSTAKKILNDHLSSVSQR
jgi:tetratricopeptide (TPR) repeat protein